MPSHSNSRAASRRSQRRIMKNLIMSQLLALSDSDSDSEDDVTAQVSLVLMSTYLMMASRSARRPTAGIRTSRRPAAVDSQEEWEKILDVTRPKYGSKEFLHHFRMDRANFDDVLALIRDHQNISEPGPDFEDGYELSCSPKLHLLVTLKYFGSEGSDDDAIAEEIKELLGITKESVLTYVNRTVEALASLKDDEISWPDAEERREISNRIETAYQFPNCVGFVDGNHLVLEHRPEPFGGTFLTPNERNYAFKALVISDDLLRIRHLHIGHKGSAEDSLAWESSTICFDKELYFGPREYLLGDAAFDSISCLVSPYKKLPGNSAVLSEHAWFNEKLSAPCSKSEEAIEIWKGRFPYMRNIRVRIRDAPSARLAIRHAFATAVLHNLLVSHKIPQEWIVKEEVYTVDDYDDDDDMYDDDVECRTLMNRHNGDGARREEIRDYIEKSLIT